MVTKYDEAKDLTYPAIDNNCETSGSRLLLVDQKQVLLDVMSTYLEKLGYQLETATSVDTCEHLIRSQHFNLMIVDLAFLHCYGTQLVTTFKAVSGASPILVLTNMGYDEAFLNRIIAKGATQSVSKTLPINHLAHSVTFCLRGSHFSKS